MEKTVLITGASSGIGRACALHMDRLGWRVFAGVRRQADADSLRAEGSKQLTPLLLDVTDPKSAKEAARVVEASVGEAGLSGLVNNAGVPYGGPIEFLNLDEIRRVFEINYFGVIALTQIFIPHLRRARGRIVNMSSISGLTSSPFLSPYSTSKFALEALSDSLRVELSPWGIDVAVIEPGAIATPIWNKAGDTIKDLLEEAPPEGMELYGSLLDAMQGIFETHGIPAEEVAKAVAHALTARRPGTRYAVGNQAKAVQLLRLLPDRLRDRLIRAGLPKWGESK